MIELPCCLQAVRLQQHNGSRVAMSIDLYRSLSWLPAAPCSFAGDCKELARSRSEAGRRARALASHALDENQLGRLGRAIGAARANGCSFSPLVPFRLGLLGNGTLDLILPVLVATAARHGIALECVGAAYDQFLQDALDPQSAVNRARCDAVLLALDYRGLGLQPCPGNAPAAAQAVETAAELLQTLRAAIARNSGACCIVQTLAPPPESLFGSLDRGLPGTARSLIDALNRRIVQSLLESEDVLLDVAGIAETVGLAEWHSPALWNMAKLPFADSYVPFYAAHVARVIGAMRG